jgi:hypothetical protein
MLCQIVIAIGLSFGCIDQPPPRDQAAEILIEQERQRDAEFEAAKAKRNRLYRGMGECRDCGKLDTVPFPQRKD